MRIVVTMLSGGDHEDTAPTAILSTKSFADEILLIDTGPSAQKAIAAIMALPDIGYKCMPVKYPREFTRKATADARNFCLEQAYEFGDWACILDTDEIINTNGFDVKTFLVGLSWDIDFVEVYSQNLTGPRYAKARFIRLPAKGRYHFPVHEDYLNGGRAMAIHEVTFTDMPKSAELERRNSVEIEQACREWIAEAPEEPRPWLFLANALSYQGRHEDSIKPYLQYARRISVSQEKGWAIFCAAMNLGVIGKRKQSIALCLRGMTVCPSFPEFPWWIGIQYLGLNQPVEAIAWADMAIALGAEPRQMRVAPARLGFQSLEASHEGPWEIREVVMAAIGNTAEVDLARQMIARLSAMRLQGGNVITGPPIVPPGAMMLVGS